MDNEKEVKITRDLNLSFIKEKAVPLFLKYNIRRSSVFGSFVRGEVHENSDLDMLIEFDPATKPLLSLFAFIHIENELSDALGIKVDLGEYHNIKPVVRERILREQVQIFPEDKKVANG